MRAIACVFAATCTCTIGLIMIGCGFSFGAADIGDDDTLAKGRSRSNPSSENEDAAAAPPPSAPIVDAGGKSTSDAGTTADAAPKGPLKAFVSSTLTTGNIGGVTGADALCNNAAKAANLPGTYVAWISTTAVNAIDRITAAGPWQLVDGTEVFKTKGDLTKGNLVTAFRKDEKNNQPPIEEDRVWTGTGPDGNRTAATCNNWGGTTDTGNVGEAEQKNGGWTALTNENCTEVNRVYCLQQ